MLDTAPVETNVGFRSVQMGGGATGFNFQWAGPDAYVNFTVTGSDSTPIVVSPRYTWRRQALTMNGSWSFRGTMEIKDQTGNILAFADDVNLVGGFSAVIRIYNNVPDTSRAINFGGIDFRLDNPVP